MRAYLAYTPRGRYGSYQWGCHDLYNHIVVLHRRLEEQSIKTHEITEYRRKAMDALKIKQQAYTSLRSNIAQMTAEQQCLTAELASLPSPEDISGRFQAAVLEARESAVAWQDEAVRTATEETNESWEGVQRAHRAMFLICRGSLC